MNYLDLLFRALTENAEGHSDSVMNTIASALKVEREVAAERLSQLSIADQTIVVDAASNGDFGTILVKMEDRRPEPDPNEDETLEEAGAPLQNLPPQPTGNMDFETPDGQLVNGGPQPGRPPFPPQAPQGQPQQAQQPVATAPERFQNQGPQTQPPRYQGGQPQQAVPGQPQQQTNRTQSKGSQGPQPGRPQQQFPVAESQEFNVGDAVVVGDDEIEGTISAQEGPQNSDLVGVLINGSIEMVSKKKVKRVLNDKSSGSGINEHVLGMTNMPSINRILELAGLRNESEEEKKDDKPWLFKKKEETETEDKADEPEDKADEPAAPKEKKVEQPSQPKADDGPDTSIEVQNLQTGETHSIKTKAEPEAKKEEEEKADPRDAIMTALQTIEQNLPDLRVGDFKDIRKRLETLQNVVVETALNRKRKV